MILLNVDSVLLIHENGYENFCFNITAYLCHFYACFFKCDDQNHMVSNLVRYQENTCLHKEGENKSPLLLVKCAALFEVTCYSVLVWVTNIV